MLNIFVGFDSRQPVAFTVLQMSIMARASKPVAITPLILDTLPIARRGLTEFTYSRYLVPWLMDYRGTALFLDADMLALWDIAELFDLADERYAVQVVKSGQRFEWPSLMLFNCEQCGVLTPSYVETGRPADLEWGEVGDLPSEWNFTVGYDAPRENIKLLHYTMGVPAFPETRCVGFVEEWKADLRAACSTVPWEQLMGGSVHKQRLEQFLAASGQNVAS